MAKTTRETRWADFQRRVRTCRAYPEDGVQVYEHRTRGWEYVPVHPFGDEPEVLKRLGLRPQDCRVADAWWGIDGDATLLESGTASGLGRPPSLFAKPTPHEERWVYLVAVFDAPFVTREAFEEAMIRFADAGFPNRPEFQLQKGDQPFHLPDSIRG